LIGNHVLQAPSIHTDVTPIAQQLGIEDDLDACRDWLRKAWPDLK
jgi:hypothetical protein